MTRRVLQAILILVLGTACAAKPAPRDEPETLPTMKSNWGSSRSHVAREPAPKKHPRHEHEHLHPHATSDHHHHPHPHPHLTGEDGQHHPY